ncbi:MAG: glutamine-hydrolyzing carbamoyl-phosphate synthase small subunit [Paludibacteraceae bacterium]|nr:glutamine-hydrolyzing carbamoyl-phosphate synthase small subunit [Paludibacteraceae bacterium]MBP3574883.1 glutamine-hydrolyzing carbamoyl-phosphate synthase small subunit [Paludibacteraceae bacterium]
MSKVTLKLSDGTCFKGTSFGYEKNVAGELVFNTTMIGYPEVLTDSGFEGQIVVMTYPLVGNYGVPACSSLENGLSEFMDSHKIHPAAIIMTEYSPEFSHWNAKESLGEWLMREQIPAITGVDTRELTKHLREKGSMQATLIFEGDNTTPVAKEGNLVAEVSSKEVVTYNAGAGKKVVLVDCGVKEGIIRYLLSRGVEVIRVPWDYDFNQLEANAVIISNGPGNPEECTATIEHIKTFLAKGENKPLLGLDLGNLLIALAAGAKVLKHKYGHHGATQPVQLAGGQRCYITAQNHGYVVDGTTLPAEWKEWFVNMNDQTNEGIRHAAKPWMAVQFIPEMNCGPVDSEFVFNNFFELLNK